MPRFALGGGKHFSVSGHRVVGEALTVSAMPGFVITAVQWLRDGVAIAGETGMSYQLASADEGAIVYPLVTGYSAVSTVVYSPIPSGPDDITLRPSTHSNLIHNGYGSANSTGTRLGNAIRFGDTIGGDQTEISLLFYNRYMLSSSVGETTVNANEIPLTAASIEINGVSVPVTFNGDRSIVIGIDGSDVWSDAIPASAFNLEVIPDGATVYVQMRILMTGPSVIPTNTCRMDNFAGCYCWYYDPTVTFPSSVDQVGAMTYTGTSVYSQVAGFRPFIFGKHSDPNHVALVGRGDSIMMGMGDSASGASCYGFLNRTLPLLSIPVSCLNLAVGGSSSMAGTTDEWLGSLYGYCTHGVIEYGTNDIGTSGTPGATAQASAIMANLIAIEEKMKEQGVKKVAVCGTMPRTSSTDLWVTEANQTPLTGWAPGSYTDQLHAAISAYGFDAVVWFDSLRGTQNSYVWTGDETTSKLYTIDGTHGNKAGYLRAAQNDVLPVLASMLVA